MANQGFGMGGAPGAAEFGDLARQYWDTWGRMMGGAVQASAAQPATPWADPAAWWSAATGSRPQAESELDATMRRYGQQASGWFAQMQQLASRFAGQDASAADIATAWRQMLAANPLAQGFGAMPGAGAAGASWPSMAQALQFWQRETQAWLGLPTFGFAREHQERWQRLAAAQVEAQQASAAYNELMAQALQDALGRFEKKLAARSEPGRQLDSARALFDLWVDAAEEAYADSALSPRFREVYGAMVDSQMRVRGALQREIEEVAGTLGLPTRTEVDAAHRKTVQLEREVRRLRDAIEQLRAASSPSVAEPSSPAGDGRPASAPAAASRKPAAGSPSTGANRKRSTDSTPPAARPGRTRK